MTNTPELSFFSFASVLTLLLMAGCSISNTGERSEEIRWVDFSKFSQDSTALVGAWKWKYTLCCYGDLDISTPKSSGKTETLVFTNDDTVKVYRKDRLKRQLTYEEYFDDAKWGVKGETFAISTAYKDGPQSVFRKE